MQFRIGSRFLNGSSDQQGQDSHAYSQYHGQQTIHEYNAFCHVYVACESDGGSSHGGGNGCADTHAMYPSHNSSVDARIAYRSYCRHASTQQQFEADVYVGRDNRSDSTGTVHYKCAINQEKLWI